MNIGQNLDVLVALVAILTPEQKAAFLALLTAHKSGRKVAVPPKAMDDFDPTGNCRAVRQTFMRHAADSPSYPKTLPCQESQVAYYTVGHM